MVKLEAMAVFEPEFLNKKKKIRNHCGNIVSMLQDKDTYSIINKKII